MHAVRCSSSSCSWRDGLATDTADGAKSLLTFIVDKSLLSLRRSLNDCCACAATSEFSIPEISEV